MFAFCSKIMYIVSVISLTFKKIDAYRFNKINRNSIAVN